MESVGVLAGGIAHAFNNFLGSILSDADLALTELSSGSSPLEEIRRIRTVAIRAAEIVRQLMIYAAQEKAHRELVDISVKRKVHNRAQNPGTFSGLDWI
jgi:two-component system, cell cycle sensor histidine kinase and response regulator CckA